MKKHNLSKNFIFIYDFELKTKNIDISRIGEVIEKIEKRIYKKDFSPIRTELRSLFEEIINSFLKEKYPNLNFSNNLYDKISYITNRNAIYFNSRERNAFNHIRIEGNEGAHSTKETESYKGFQVINLMYNFHIFLSKIFELLNIDENNSDAKNNITDFDEFIYSIEENVIIEKNEEMNFYKDSNYVANNINVQRVKIFDFLFSKDIKRKFIIPIYQRSYTWNEENVEDLLEDIKDRTQDLIQHYFGIIAAKKDTSIDNSVNDKIQNIKIIDGQQRITTTILIICAIKSIIKNENFSKNSDLDYIFNYFQGIDSFVSIIKNPIGDGTSNDEFRYILAGKYDMYGSEKGTNANTPLKNFLFAREYLIDNLKQGNFEANLINYLDTFKENFIVGLISFDEEEYDLKKELIIFENLNSKGKKLSFSDLIKTFLLNLCSVETLNQNERELTYFYTRQIINNIELSLQSNKNSNKKEEPLTNFFIKLMFYLKGKQISNKENNSFLLKTFSEVLKSKIYPILEWKREKENLSFEEFKTLISLLGDFLRFGFMPIYSLKNKHFKNELMSFDVITLLKNIPPQKLNPFYSLGFFIYEVFKTNFKISQELKKEDKRMVHIWYRTILKIITFHMVSTGAGDTTLNQKIYEKINELRNKISLPLNILNKEFLEKFKLSHFVKKDEFIEEMQISNKSDWVASKLLFLIEGYLKENKNLTDAPSDKDETLEHIMPKTLSDIWFSDLKKWDPDLKDKNVDEIKEEVKNYIHNIGNFLLISSSKNSSIQNKSFYEKKNAISKTDNGNLLFLNDDYKEIDIKNKDIWTRETILKRGEALQKILLKIFDDN